MQYCAHMHQIFKALSSEPRVALIKELLERGEYTCICEFQDIIDRDRSVAYRHFKKLEKAGLIKTRKNGKRLEAKIKEPNKLKKLLKLSKEVKG